MSLWNNSVETIFLAALTTAVSLPVMIIIMIVLIVIAVIVTAFLTKKRLQSNTTSTPSLPGPAKVQKAPKEADFMVQQKQNLRLAQIMVRSKLWKIVALQLRTTCS